MPSFGIVLVIISALMYWSFHPTVAAVLATIRSQDGGSKKTYLVEPIQPSVPNTSETVSDINGLKNVSPVGELHGSALLPSLQSVDSVLLQDQLERKNRQEKPLFMGINVILDNASSSLLSTEASSTVAVLNDHYATTPRSIDEKHSTLDPFRPELNNQSVRNTNNYGLNKDSKSIWLLDEDQDDNSEEPGDYEVIDLSQPSRLADSVTSNDELNRQQYSNHFEEAYEDNPMEDTILVIGQFSTLAPVIPAWEGLNGSSEQTHQLHKEQTTPAYIALSEWPVQVGLQARSKPSVAFKPVEFATDSLNKQPIIPGTQEPSGQQLKHSQTKFNKNHHSNGITSYAEAKVSFNGSNGDGNSNNVSFRPQIRPQFMHSDVAKTVPAQTIKKSMAIEMTNHYGNPNGGKPITNVASSATSQLEKSNHYISSQDERKQETSSTTEPDEPFYYLISEEETDHDISFNHPVEEVIKPVTAGIKTPETVARQPPSSLGRPPYFVSSSVDPLPQRRTPNFELMKPIEMVGNQMDVDFNNGIPFIDDAIQPMLLLPFPVDDALFSQTDLVVKPQPFLSTIFNLNGETATATKDSFLIDFNHDLSSVQSWNTGSSISSKGTAKSPYISSKLESEETDLKDLVQEKPHIDFSIPVEPKISDKSKPHQMEPNNTKSHDDAILPIIHQYELPSPKLMNSSTLIQTGIVSQLIRPMTASKSDAGEMSVTPNPTPFVQTAYVTRSTNKAGFGPYFVSSVQPSYRRNSYPAEEDMTRPLVEYNRISAGKKDEGIIHNSTPSTRVGRPPYFVRSPSSTPFQPMALNVLTTQPTRNMKIEDENSDKSLPTPTSHVSLRSSSSETHTSPKQQTATTRVPEEKTTGFQSDDFDISFGPVRPTVPYILTQLNAVQPSFVPSSVASNVTERILDIDLPIEEGMEFKIGSLPSPIGISNKENVFVVPKKIGNDTIQTPVYSSTVPTVLSVSKSEASNRNNQLESTMGTVMYHNMGSFVVTSSPMWSFTQPTYPFRPATVVDRDVHNKVKSMQSEERNYKIDVDNPEQEKINTAVVQNPIGISNKDNVFVVPKTAKGIIQPPIRGHTLPTDTLMKRLNSNMNGEQKISTSKPLERIVSHQMGSFVVNLVPPSVQKQQTKAAIGTVMSTKIPEIVVGSSTEPADLVQSSYFATNTTYEQKDSKKRKIGKSGQLVRSRKGMSSRNTNISRIEPLVRSTLVHRIPAEQSINRSNVSSRRQQYSKIALQWTNERHGNRLVDTASPRP